MNSAVQIYEFMGCIYAGIIMGIVYALFGLLRTPLRHSRVAIMLCDGAYLFVCFCIACIALYILTSGRVLMYHFIGFFTGALLYIRNTHMLFCRIFGRD